MIDKLITELIRYVRANHGAIYTSTNLRDNPDVCHACCLWFIDRIKRGNGIQQTLQELDSTPKSKFQTLQKQCGLAPSIPKKMLSQARNSSKQVTDGDISSLKHVLSCHSQPRPQDYIGDVVTAVANIAVSFAAGNAESKLIYMNANSGSGHVICIIRNIGGILIYDPNIGIISVRLSARDTWTHILRKIMGWYKEHMKLTKFAYLEK